MIKQNEITNYWEKEVCGTRYIDSEKYDPNNYKKLRNLRYSLEPYIREFAFGENKEDIKGKYLLEIGVGAGIDFIEFLKKGAICYGIDATNSAIKETERNIKYALAEREYSLSYLKRNNAEELPFK